MFVRNSPPLLSECQELCDAVQTSPCFAFRVLIWQSCFRACVARCSVVLNVLRKAVKVKHTLAAVA